MEYKNLRDLVCIGLMTMISWHGGSVGLAQGRVGAPPPPPPPPPPSMDTPPPPPMEDSVDSGNSDSSAPSPSASLPPGGSVKKIGKDTAQVTLPEKRGAEAIPPGQELVNMDFPEKTEIRDIVRAVALWTGKNVILDNNVSGKIQIISPRRVTKEEAYQAFLSALNVLRLTTVETGKILKIVPISTAVRGNLRTFLGSKWTPLTDEIITQIVPLKYVDAKSISSTLSKIVTLNSMVAYEKTNTLIISDSGYKVRRILDILDLIDVQGQQPQVQFVPIRHADAKTINDRVTEILKANSAGGGSYGSFKLMVDDRTNSVIVFGPPRTIADIQSLIKKFDIELDDPNRQSSIHVRPLDYADAKKVATTLQALAQGGKKKTPSFGPPSGIPGGPPGSGGSQGVATADFDENVKITADESSNSLLITGSRSSYQAVNSILRKLDIRRSQVYVEADILDLDSGNGFQFGTSIFGGGKSGQNPIITTWQGSQMAPVIAAQAAATTPSADSAAKVASAFATDDMTIGILSGKTVDIPGLGKISPGALIKLIKVDSNTRVLSSPHIMTADNEEATISVGEKVFFRTSEANATTGTSIPKVEKEDVDTSLKIKPNISNSNYVTMKIDIDSSSVALDPTGLPRVSKRKTGQLLTVKNGQTVVVSGLVKSYETETFKKIPLLGDIPILGWLFRNSDIKHQTSNLMIFLTPHVVHGADDMANIYQAKIKERDEYMSYLYGKDFKDDRFYSSLPKAEDGQYHPDAKDVDETKRREEVRSSYMNDDTDADMINAKKKAEMAAPTSVPMNATTGGGPSGGDLGIPPPPVNGPASPLSGGGEDSSPSMDSAPEPINDLPPPPPPPPSGE